MQTRNPYEHQHRLLKAVRIVDFLEENAISLEETRRFDERRQTAVCANISAGKPSKETWEMVCELYGKRLSDPFQ
jgi:hypothetical protein